MNKRSLLILGAGVYQLPLIKKAKELGLTTIVVSRKGKYPGIPLADVFLDIDTTDVERVVKAAKEYAVSGVVTTGTDVCLPAMGKVVDECGLVGSSYEAARRSMDKVLMKRAFIENEVPTAAFEQFEDSEDALDFAETLGFPVMVKATDSSGSGGITKVNDREEFQEAWDRAWEVSRSKEIIVEEYLSGLEFGAQAFVKGEKLIAVFPHGDTVTPEPYFTPIGHSIPINFSEEQLQKTKETIEKAVQALGLRDCVANVDLMFVDGEPKLIELGARMGATCLPENISIYSGTDAYEYLIRLSLGEEVSIPVVDKQPNASFLLQSDKTGKVIHLHVKQKVLDHPDLVDFQWDIQVGDDVRAFRVGPDRIGHIIVKANTPDEGERLVKALAGKVSIVVKA